MARATLTSMQHRFVESLDWGGDGLPRDMAVHPSDERLIIRLTGICSSMVDPDEKIENTLQQHHRLRQCGVRVPAVTYHPFQLVNHSWQALIYIPRLEGDQPDPSNSRLELKLLQLGRGLLKYYTETAPGDYYLSDVDTLEQYTYGRPYRSVTPAMVTMHDMNPFVERRGILTDADNNAFIDSLEELYSWVGKLPASTMRDKLLHGTEQLRDEAQTDEIHIANVD